MAGVSLARLSRQGVFYVAASKMKKSAQSGVDICYADYFANERRSLCG
jgi:hypothetical protein